MYQLTVFLLYDGNWDDNNRYVNCKMHGILLPSNCEFSMLIELLSKELKINLAEKNMTIEYQVTQGYPPIKITSDSAVLFYMELKKKDTTLTSFPLCLTLQDSSIVENPSQKNKMKALVQSHSSLEDSDLLSSSNHSSINFVENDQLPNFIDIANNVTRLIMQKEEELEEQNNNEPIREVITTADIQEVAEGQVYKDKSVLKAAMSLYAIRNSFQFKVNKSCKIEYTLQCLDRNCKWSFRASRYRKSSMFIIRRFYSIHTCSLDLILGDHRQATSSMVGECIKSKYLDVKTVYNPNDIVRDMLDTYGISLSYEKAWRSREKALEMVRGKADKSYGLLPSYLYMLTKTNPGSVVDLLTDNNNRFKYLFMALASSIAGWRHCKPVIVVDGTFLKASFGGTLFTAYTKDANENIFPLAFAITDSENDASWEWFFIKIRESFGDRDGLCIVSDRHESIKKAVEAVYPNATHGACIFHIINNLKTNFKSKSSETFKLASTSYTIKDFECHMAKLDKIDGRIRSYLLKIGYDKWSRVHSPNKRYTLMTSNIAESMNSANREVRELPVGILVECLRNLVQQWSFKNRNQAEATFTKGYREYI